MPNFKRPRRFGTLVLSLCAALALPGGPAAASTEGITVEAAEFIVSVGDGEGGERRIASTLVPYLPDQACFGWRIRLAEAPPVVRVREVLKLPEAPAFWSGEDDPSSTHVFSADRNPANTEDYRTSGLSGRSVSLRVVFGGRRIIQKTHLTNQRLHIQNTKIH